MNVVGVAEHAIGRTEGDLAELGVNAGQTFIPLVEMAQRYKRLCWGFDSFEGMGDPGPFDGDRYPRGRLKANKSLLELALLDRRLMGVNLIQGWLPDSWSHLPENRRLAFAYIDLDHYEPTRAVLPLVWDRIDPGGVLLCDDYLPDSQRELLATRAICEWLDKPAVQLMMEVEAIRLVRSGRKLAIHKMGQSHEL